MHATATRAVLNVVMIGTPRVGSSWVIRNTHRGNRDGGDGASFTIGTNARSMIHDAVHHVGRDTRESRGMTDLSTFAALVPLDHGLCVLSTLRGDGSVQASVVNAGVLAHPVTGAPVVGLVVAGGARKLAHLRADPRVTIVARAGWRWATVEGTAEIVGPDDLRPDIDDEGLRTLLRDVFRAAGGTHDDWDEYDRAMADERRAAVLITATRAYTNPQAPNP